MNLKERLDRLLPPDPVCLPGVVWLVPGRRS